MAGKLFRWWPTKKKGTPGEPPETAKVYVKPDGSLYVKAEEVFASKRGRAVLERAAKRDLTKLPGQGGVRLDEGRRKSVRPGARGRYRGRGGITAR